MKYRIFGITAAVLMIAAVILCLYIDADEKDVSRYHQHMSARQPDEGCDCDGSELCTHLPILIIDTDGKDIPGVPLSDEGKPLTAQDEEYEYTEVTLAEDGSKTILTDVSVIDHNDRNNHPGDEPTLETKAQVRIRGNTSRLHDKKGYLISTTTEDGLKNNDVEMLGMDSHHEWALHGPYLDKTMMRNYMWYNIAGEFMDYSPNCRFCEVIINGEYQGLYLMVETITDGDGNRLSLSKPENDSQREISYVVRLDRGSSNELKNIESFSMYALRTLNQIDIVYPGTTELSEERIEYIEDDLSKFEKTLYSFDYDTNPYAWWNYMDETSIADYFIVNEFTCNYDVGGRSTYLYKDARGKYKMVIWDMNSSCDNFHDSTIKPHRFNLNGITWFYMLVKDDMFVDLVIERYRELRETFLSEEYLISYVDDVVDYLGPAIDRNFDIWGYTFEDYRVLTPDSRNPDDYDEAIAQLKDFCVERGEWLDKNIEILKQYSHESKVKKFNHDR